VPSPTTDPTDPPTMDLRAAAHPGPATAIVFPGQGSQAPGLGRPWVDRPQWRIVRQAERASGLDLSRLLLDADHEELAGTRTSQLVVLVASLLAWEDAVAELDPTDVVAVAGHSLGQITALIAAKVVTLADGIRLAAARAEAAEQTQRADPGGMVALLGADVDLVERACAATDGRAWVAIHNGAGQVVVGAEEAALDEVAGWAVALGCRRATRLAVDGAFHTPLHQPTAEALLPTLAGITFGAPRWPVVTNHDARPVLDGDGWPERLVAHLVEPVRWDATVTRLAAMGTRRFVEVGPGRSLSGLIRRITPDLECV
jgi:[acyl-carrier-protein] S-malonyltransferase